MKAPSIISGVARKLSKLHPKSTVLLYEPEGNSHIAIAKYLKEERGFICGVYKKFKPWSSKNLKNKYDLIIVPSVFSEPGTNQQALYDNICGLLNQGGELFIYTLGRDIGHDIDIGTGWDIYFDKVNDGLRGRSYVNTKSIKPKTVDYNTNNEEVTMDTKARLTEEEKAKIVEMHNAGITEKAITEETGRSISTVLRLIRGPQRKLKSGSPKTSLTKDEIENIIQLYNDGVSVTNIVNDTKRSRGAVLNVLKVAGCYDKPGENKPKEEAPAPVDTFRVHVPGYPPQDVVSTLAAAVLLKGRGFSPTFGNMLKSAQCSRGLSTDKFGFWLEKLPLGVNATKDGDTMQDISNILDGKQSCLSGDTLMVTSEGMIAVGDIQGLREILNMFPMPLDVIGEVLGDYYANVYLPEQNRKKALEDIQKIITEAGLTSEDIMNIL